MTIRDLEKVGKITILHGIIFLGVQNVLFLFLVNGYNFFLAVSKLMNIKTINFYLKHFFVFEYLWIRRSLKILHQKMNICKTNHMMPRYFCMITQLDTCMKCCFSIWLSGAG